MLTPDDLNELANDLNDRLSDLNNGEKLGFALVLFPFGDPNSAGQYTSNADMGGVINTLRDVADHLEERKTAGELPPGSPNVH